MGIDPRDLKAGDLFDRSGSTFYLQSIVMEVAEDGLWVELVSKPRTYNSFSPKFKSYVYWRTAGHRSFIKYDSTYWKEDLVKTGSMPALLTQTFVKIEVDSESGL